MNIVYNRIVKLRKVKESTLALSLGSPESIAWKSYLPERTFIFLDITYDIEPPKGKPHFDKRPKKCLSVPFGGPFRVYVWILLPNDIT